MKFSQNSFHFVIFFLFLSINVSLNLTHNYHLGSDSTLFNHSIKYEEQSPIYINGNSNFSATATKENWVGDGSLTFPYEITGYNITGPSDKNLIEIRNTNVHFHINACFLYGGKKGISLTNVINGLITYNTIIENNAKGISIEFSESIIIDRNTITKNSLGGVQLVDSNNNIISRNNMSRNNWDGIFFIRSKNNTLSNNTIGNNEKNGINLYDSGNNVLSKNLVSDSVQIGIFFDESESNSLRDNLIFNNMEDGISLWNSRNCTLSDNNLFNNHFNGINIQNSDSTSLFSNLIHKNGMSGINNSRSQNCNISSNVISRNFRHGIVLFESESCFLSTNTVDNNKNVGIIIRNSRSNILSNNIASNNSGYGIELYKSESCILSANTVNNNSYGIYIEYSSNNSLYGNVFSNNTNFGIYLSSQASNNLFEWNDFIGNNIGVSSQALDSGENNNFSYNYWSEWTDPDINNDGIVDDKYPIFGVITNTYDPYPLSSRSPPHQLSPLNITSPITGETISEMIIIEWTVVNDSWRNHLISYSVYYSTDGGNEWTLLVSGLTTTNYTWDTTLFEDNSTYMIKVVATCSGDLSSTAFSGEFAISNSPKSSLYLVFLMLLIIMASIAIGFIMWKKKAAVLPRDLENLSIAVCIGSLTDEGLSIQGKGGNCSFDDHELRSMIEYSAVLYQHGEIENIYGPFPHTSIVEPTDIEWHFLSFSFNVRDNMVKDPRILKLGGVVPAILIIFYQKQFDKIILSKRDEITQFLKSNILSDISEISLDWIKRIEDELYQILIK
ncbi:MAG: NosD domain-containing protein [Promethearchaeota archaeon]